MAGSITVLIGPNGFGKSTFLQNYRKELVDSGIPENEILFLESEIKLLDEVKDTVDTSQTMEYLLTELIETDEYLNRRQAMYDEADRAIRDSVGDLNTLVDSILGLNGSTRGGDFISSNAKRTVKNLVSINQRDIKNKMGSGQRMQLLLSFARKSKKSHIILDEPEKYSHPSLLNGTAEVINELVDAGKDVVIATHSPKLVSMLELDYDSILVINDGTHATHSIPFEEAVDVAGSVVNLGALADQHKRYYLDGDSLKESLARRHGRQFIESLFTKRVYLCEGANDEIFLNECLKQLGGYYDDYCIVKVWGKYNLPVFIALYQLLGIELVVLFDVDDESKSETKKLNEAVRSFAGPNVRVVECVPNLEVELGYTGLKGNALAFMDYLEGISIDQRFKLV